MGAIGTRTDDQVVRPDRRCPILLCHGRAPTTRAGSRPPRRPRDATDDYTPQAAAERRRFLEQRTGASLENVSAFSFDPHVAVGNVEQFVGVAQVPIGLAGPLRVNGEHAQGDFYVPMATAEGTLVASYNRGMRLLHETGGVTTTVVNDHMQRAFAEVKAAAEATTSTGRLQEIERYAAGRILYTRFNCTTGDAAGQNLTGKATQAACRWILARRPEVEQFFLESNFATDKKSSQVNMLRTRGKKVIAEATIPDELFRRVMRSDSGLMYRARQVSNLGGFMSGVNNNGAHSANGITAMFIATGQDVANAAESSAATVLCVELSLGSAIVTEEWVDAHDLYGRNRP